MMTQTVGGTDEAEAAAGLQMSVRLVPAARMQILIDSPHVPGSKKGSMLPGRRHAGRGNGSNRIRLSVVSSPFSPGLPSPLPQITQPIGPSPELYGASPFGLK